MSFSFAVKFFVAFALTVLGGSLAFAHGEAGGCPEEKDKCYDTDEDKKKLKDWNEKIKENVENPVDVSKKDNEVGKKAADHVRKHYEIDKEKPEGLDDVLGKWEKDWPCKKVKDCKDDPKGMTGSEECSECKSRREPIRKMSKAHDEAAKAWLQETEKAKGPANDKGKFKEPAGVGGINEYPSEKCDENGNPI